MKVFQQQNLKTAFGVLVVFVILELLGFGPAALAARARALTTSR